MIDFIKGNSLYISVALGIILGAPLIRRKATKIGLGSTPKLIGVCALFSVISVVSVLLFASIESFLAGKGFSFGAISTYGLYFISPVILLILFYKSKNSKELFDMYSFYILPSMILQRIRCMLNGCCMGTLIGSTGLRWPTREAEIVFYIAMIFILSKKEKKTNSGGLFPLVMIYYGTFRFVVEFFRETPNHDVIHMAHMWSVLAIVIGLSIYAEFKKTGGKRV